MPEPEKKFPWGDEDRRQSENQADRIKFSRHLQVVERALELRDKRRAAQVETAEPEKVNLLDW